MTGDGPGPLTRLPAWLRIVATLAALPGGDALSFTRLQDMTGLMPGSLLIHLSELEAAGYARRDTPGGGAGAPSAVTLTQDGRAALEHYAGVLRHLAAGTASEDHLAPAPGVCIGDADRDTAAAVLGEHFAHGRLTRDELDARLDAILAATTHGEISQVTSDLPGVRVLPVTPARRLKARPGHRPGPAASQATLPRHRGRTRGGSS
jgi:hypothetical protein